MKNSKNETIQKFTPKWILASSIFQTKGLKYPRNKKNTTSFPEITSNSKTTTDLFPETLMNSNKNSPYNPEKIVLGTNIFTQTKSLAFMQYRNNLGSENEQLKKRESSKKFKFLLSLRNQVSQNDKLTFTSKTTHSKFKFFDEFKVQMTAEDIEFEKKIDYDEKIYEENMKERKNVIETIQNFEDDVELTNALANYKYEFYKRKGFKTNNFNLSEDKNDYSLEEFSVIRQIRNTRGEAEIFRKKINDNLVKKQNYDIHNKVRDNLEIAIRNSTISLTISPKMSPTLSPSRRKELKRKYTKQASNKNFMFWLDLNKSQRILLKMKNFFAKIIKLKISLREVYFH